VALARDWLAAVVMPSIARAVYGLARLADLPGSFLTFVTSMRAGAYGGAINTSGFWWRCHSTRYGLVMTEVEAFQIRYARALYQRQTRLI
jgi:hypothetical protein